MAAHFKALEEFQLDQPNPGYIVEGRKIRSEVAQTFSGCFRAALEARPAY